jgi:hypothetical protein
VQRTCSRPRIGFRPDAYRLAAAACPLVVTALVFGWNDATAVPLFTAPFLAFVTNPIPTAIAAGDLDGDGRPEIVTADLYTRTISVLHGVGDGTFGASQRFGVDRAPRGLALGDLNGDGNLDVAVANSASASVSVLLGNGDGTFGERSNLVTGVDPGAVALADLDGDGALDLVTLNRGDNNPPGTLSILRGNGDGTFGTHVEVTTDGSPVALRVGDVDGDAVPDLVVATTDPDQLVVLHGRGDGTFGPNFDVPLPGQPAALGLGDFDGDGIQDAAVFHQSFDPGYAVQLISIFLGRRDAEPTPMPDVPADGFEVDIAVGDVNGDGRADLVALGPGIQVVPGRGDGTFDYGRLFDAGAGPEGVAIADWNGAAGKRRRQLRDTASAHRVRSVLDRGA